MTTKQTEYVITEGVETSSEMKVLSEMGYRHFWGYYFSKPLSLNKFEKSLTAGLKWHL